MESKDPDLKSNQSYGYSGQTASNTTAQTGFEESGDISEQVKKHNNYVTYNRTLFVIMAVLGGLFVLFQLYMAEAPYVSMGEGAYLNAKLNGHVSASADGSAVALSYYNDSLKKEMLLFSQDSGKTYSSLDEPDNKPLISVVSVTPDNQTIILGDEKGNLYIKRPDQKKFEILKNSLGSPMPAIESICYNPGTTLAYVIGGEGQQAFQLDYSNGQTTLVKSPSGSQVISLGIKDQTVSTLVYNSYLNDFFVASSTSIQKAFDKINSNYAKMDSISAARTADSTKLSRQHVKGHS